MSSSSPCNRDTGETPARFVMPGFVPGVHAPIGLYVDGRVKPTAVRPARGATIKAVVFRHAGKGAFRARGTRFRSRALTFSVAALCRSSEKLRGGSDANEIQGSCGCGRSCGD